jgi:hypothetical protein
MGIASFDHSGKERRQGRPDRVQHAYISSSLNISSMERVPGGAKAAAVAEVRYRWEEGSALHDGNICVWGLLGALALDHVARKVDHKAGSMR